MLFCMNLTEKRLSFKIRAEFAGFVQESHSISSGAMAKSGTDELSTIKNGAAER